MEKCLTIKKTIPKLDRPMPETPSRLDADYLPSPTAELF